MQKIFIKVTENRLWILDYNFVCAIFFIPVTAYASVKVRNMRKGRKRKLEQERKIEQLEKLYRILKVAGSPMSELVLLRILQIRGGADVVVVPGIDDCIDLPKPSYVDNERILRFLNDKYRHLAIRGIIYITKEALCFLAAKEGLVDFPVVFLERVKIDGVYSFAKTASQWAVWSIAAVLGIGGVIAPHYAILSAGFAWLHINEITISEPTVKEVDKLTGKYVPRIGTRKDAIAFDAKNEPLPPVIEKTVKPVRVSTLDTEYEITEKHLVDVSTVSGLKNKFSDRRFIRSKRKAGKTVYFSDMVKRWSQEQDMEGDAGSVIDQMIEDGII